MTNKERLELNNAKIDEITRALERKQVSPIDMLQQRVDGDNTCRYLFYYYQGKNLDFIKNLDTSNVTNMESMFQYCTKLESLDLSNFDTSKVTSMKDMFYNCSSLTSLDLSNFNCEKLIYMQEVFYACYKLEQIKLFNTSNVSNMYRLFYDCNSLTTIQNLDTSNTTALAYLFYNCYKLTTIPLLDTSKATNTSYMFAYCKLLENIPSLDTKNVTDVSYMFRGCSSLRSILGLDLIKTTNTNNMFIDCTALENITLKNIKVALTLGSGTSYGTKLTNESLINTFKELWDLTGSTSQKLTLSTTSKNNIANIYVKLVDVTDEMLAQDQYAGNKKPCVVCEPTDEGAMTLTEYATSKNWAIA